MKQGENSGCPEFYFKPFLCRKRTKMNISCLEERLSKAASIVLSLWFSLSGVAAVTGNVLMLWLFYKNASLRTISNRFLASLSLADFVVGLVVDPVWIAIRCLIQPPVQSISFEVINLLWTHTTAATSFNLCCVSVDRFISIRFPLRYQDIVTKKRCHTVICLVWLLSLGLPFSMMLVNDKGHVVAELLSTLAFIIFAIPLSVVCLVYIFVFKEAGQKLRGMTDWKKVGDYDENTQIRAMKNFKAIKTVGLVLGACIITWLPSLVLLLLHFYYSKANHNCKRNRLIFVVWPWVEAIAFTSSAINPSIYYFRNQEFRQAFRSTFRFLRSQINKENRFETVSKNKRKYSVGNRMVSGNLEVKETDF